MILNYREHIFIINKTFLRIGCNVTLPTKGLPHWKPILQKGLFALFRLDFNFSLLLIVGDGFPDVPKGFCYIKRFRIKLKLKIENVNLKVLQGKCSDFKFMFRSGNRCYRLYRLISPKCDRRHDGDNNVECSGCQVT